jgi:hypothetical protein
MKAIVVWMIADDPFFERLAIKLVYGNHTYYVTPFSADAKRHVYRAEEVIELPSDIQEVVIDDGLARLAHALYNAQTEFLSIAPALLDRCTHPSPVRIHERRPGSAMG